MNKISIIIPTLNEEHSIGKLLYHLIASSSSKNISDIIVVDGGSSDKTLEMIKSDRSENKIKIMVLNSEKGRAKQMNTGAKKASGDILYFLHADSFPPKNFDNLIVNEVIKGNPAGCFKMKFDTSHWWLKFISWFTKFNWRASRGGDQSQFVTKYLFEELGGFDETFTVYEDYEFINKLYAEKQFVVIQEWIKTSARRYEDNGVWKLQFYFLRIYTKKWFGASAEELHQYYLKHIA